MSQPPSTTPGRPPQFRATEYLFPVLLVLLTAWGGWVLIRRAQERVRQREARPELRLPVPRPHSNAPAPAP